MNILSIQSHVSYGHVGNSAAVFPLQRLGHEVWPVYTVNFSNHTGYGQWGGSPIPASEVTAIISAMEQRGALAQVDVVLSGYQGGTDIADAILDAVARVKAANPRATYTCDPVMGNAKSGCFVNVFRPDAAPGTIEMLAADANGAWLVSTPHLPFKANGSGDVTAALFTAHYSQHFGENGSAKQALERTKASMFELLDLTHRSGQRELQLVQAQESYVHPTVHFAAQQVR